MKQVKLLLMVMFWVSLRDVSNSVFAQTTSSPIWVYAVITTSNSYEVVRTDVSANASSEVIYTAPEVSANSLNDMLPAEEIDFAKAYYQQQGLDAIGSLLALHPSIINLSIIVSPDRQNVALSIVYKLCVHPGQFLCFGTSQLLIVQGNTKKATELWNVGYHSKIYSICSTAGKSVDSFETIRKMAWTADGKAIVISFTGDVTCYPPEGASVPIFVVIIGNKSIISAGSAIIWDVSKPNNEIDEIVERTYMSSYSLSIIQIDTQKGRISINTSQFVPGVIPNITASESVSIIRQNDLIFFSAQSPTFEGGLTVLSFKITTDSYLPMAPVPKEIQSALRGEISPDGTQTLVKTLDGKLWLVQNRDGILNAQSLVTEPVTSWTWLDNTTVFYQLNSSHLYTIIDNRGQVLKQLDLEQLVRKLYSTDSPNLPVTSISNFQ